MQRTSRTPFVILGILGLDSRRSASGYEIKQAIDRSISHFWSESYGQIYPVLKRMAKAKLISGRAVRDGERKKIVYRITPKGKASLRAWLRKTPAQGPMRDELVLKLFFGNQIDVAVSMRHLQEYRDRLAGMVQQYSQWLKQVRRQKNAYTPFQVMTLRGGVTLCSAFVKWADESVASLKRMKRKKK